MKYNNQIQKGIKDIKGVKLSSHEKESMFKHLDLYMKENPIKITSKINMWSGFFVQAKSYTYTYSIAVVLLFVFIGATVTNAAEKSLPGDTLYPIKIHVNEKVKSVVAITAKAKAKVEEEKVIKRFAEVEALVKKGKFDNEKRDQIEKEVEKSVNIINNNKQKDKDKKNNDNDNNNDNKDFKNRLDRHLENIKKVDINRDEVRKFEDKVRIQLSSFDHEEDKNKKNIKKPKKVDIENLKIKIDL